MFAISEMTLNVTEDQRNWCYETSHISLPTLTLSIFCTVSEIYRGSHQILDKSHFFFLRVYLFRHRRGRFN